MVVLFHGDVSWTRGGYLGVDVFFVLSGYLITTILLRELHGVQDVDVRAFWARRLRRIGPALALLLLGVVGYAATIARPIELVGLRPDGIAALLQVANWRFALHGASYFDALSPSLLQHTWSVSVEVQWYIAWSVVLGLLVRGCRRGDGILASIIAVLAVISAAECAVLFQLGASDARLYYGTDTRAQALLIGAALAASRPRLVECCARDTGRRWLAEVCGVVGALGLGAFLVASPSRALLYRGGLFVVALAAAALVFAASLDGMTARALSWTPLRSIGLISYSLYLWHWPIDLVVDNQRTGLTGFPLFATRTALACALATVSYHLVERPARGLGRGSRTRRPLVAVTGCVGAAVAAALVATTSAAPAEQPAPTAPVPLALHASMPIRPGVPRIFLAGDSQMWSLGWWGAPYFKQNHRATFLGSSELGCGVLPVQLASCAQRDQKWRAGIAHFNPDLTVMWVGAWEADDFTIGHEVFRHGTPPHARAVVRAMVGALRELTSRGGSVALLEVPCFGAPPGGVDASGRLDPRAVAEVNDAEQAAAARVSHVTFVRWTSLLCRDGHARDTVNGVVIRPDGVHFQSEAGAGIVLRRLLPLLTRLADRAERDRRAPRRYALNTSSQWRAPDASIQPRVLRSGCDCA